MQGITLHRFGMGQLLAGGKMIIIPKLDLKMCYKGCFITVLESQEREVRN